MNPTDNISSGALTELLALYDQGRYVAAHALAVARHGPLPEWVGGTAALIFGARLAGNLGGDRLSHALVLRARRRASADPETTPVDRANAALFHAFRTFGRRGPLALRQFLNRPGVRAAWETGATLAIRADVLCLQAHVAAAYRDTDAAEARWQEAIALAPNRAWTWTERAALLVLADRYPEALDAAHESLRLVPWYRPALQQAAHVLTLLGRDDGAVNLLENAVDPHQGGLESGAVAAQLAELLAALRRPDDALRALDRFEACSTLLEEQGRLWLGSLRGEARLQLGDFAGSADAFEPLVATSAFYGKTVPLLADPERQSERRVIHAVPFIRQHERTCAPATLTALSHFWQRPADHAVITHEICYGGTFDHQERHWAETHGWAVREFRADWPGSVAVLDAGIPFTLATTAINSGHLQAVIGYDARRDSLIIRDPMQRNEAEFLAEEFFGRYALWGPRAMAIVPADDPASVARLRALDLPETDLFDGLYHLRRALHRHDRAAAGASLAELVTLNPTPRLAFFARRELAYYDGDDPAALAAIEGLLSMFPEERSLRLEKLSLLRRLARPGEARAWLEACSADQQQTEPHLWRELARDLAADPGQQSRARQLVARSLFFEPTEAEHLRLLAELRWGERDYAEAAALFRLAATSAGTRENHWQQFFVASRHVHGTDEAVRLLEARYRRLGNRSSQPARTLYWAQRERHLFAAAAAVLDEALARRPDDGDLLLFAATAKARDGEHAAAADLLKRARGQASPGAFSRAAAELAETTDSPFEALTHWRDVLRREPLDIEAHRGVMRLLTQTDPRGAAAAREHLDAVLESFPHAIALHELRILALAEESGRGSPEHAGAVSALLEVQPGNAWVLRENVLIREAIGDLATAFTLLDEAERLDPHSAPTHALRGRLLWTAGNLKDARTSLCRALELDVNLDGVPALLLESSPSLDEKRKALGFLHGLLVRQVFVGGAILAYRLAACSVLKEPELQGQLDAILAARPDLWQAWSAVALQHADAGRLGEAHACARSAIERFPLLPNVWADLATIERMRGDVDAQVTAWERVLHLDPHAVMALGQLAALRLQLKQRAEAKIALREAMRRERRYHYAPAKLFDLQIDDHEWREAEETLLALQKYHPGAATLARTALLAAKRKNERRAASALTELLRTRSGPGVELADFLSAVNAMVDAGWRTVVENALLRAMSEPDISNLDTGAVWVRSRAGQHSWWGLSKVIRRLPDGDLARRTRFAYLSVLTEHRRRFSVLVFVWRSRQPLRAGTGSWAQAGYALTGCAWNRAGIRWLSDWKARPDVAGWMLFNLASCLRAVGRHARALEVNRWALKLPRDQTWLKHLAWVALEDSLAGDDESFRRAINFYTEIAPQLESQPQPYRYIDVLTGQILAVRSLQDAPARRAAYEAGLKTLHAERSLLARGGSAAVCRAERRARRRMARAGGAWVRGAASWIWPLPLTISRRLIVLIFRSLIGAFLFWATFHSR